jgi:hypothetical protein
MLLRLLAFAVVLAATLSANAQEQFLTSRSLTRLSEQAVLPSAPPHAWVDLRQTPAAYSKPQNVPTWVEAVELVPVPQAPNVPARSIFRIRIKRPAAEQQLLFCRVFFDDNPEQRPTITVWDELGTVVLQSGQLGAGIQLPSSDSAILPMIGASAIDIEVPGDGKNVRGAYLEWMSSRHIAAPAAAVEQRVFPQPFAAAGPLAAPEQDVETMGTVTATLAQEAIRIGASVQTGAAFQFPIEALPLTALITFEVSSARVDAPPEIYLNGESLGPVSLTLPDLADPGYRGETQRLIGEMRFHYTGWLRGQKLISGMKFRAGTNDLLVIGGPGTPASAIRATQIQLKYLWDKSDYLLETK